ncbi:MAG: M56 family metallopeptidase [Lachnospiraceae bacterium]|nr:M56 family metallopeptidase [Lachnospiraceae bacterium]
MIELLVEKWIAIAFIIVAICVIRMLGRGRIRSGMIYALWGVVVLRLLWPASLTLPESRYSIQNWQVSQKISQEISKEILNENVWGQEQNIEVQNQQNATAQMGQNFFGQQQGSQRPEQSLQNGQLMQDQVQQQVQQENQYVQEASQQVDLFDSIPVWFWAWISGTILLGIVMAASQVRFLRRLKRERVFWKSADQLTDLVDTPIPVYLWEGSTSPFLYGVLHPAIYLPKVLTEEEQTLEYALLHEWCHYRHGDHIWALTRVICLALYWHHPLVWAAASLSRSDCELACDDSVRVCLGEKQRLAYAGSLLSILEAEVQRERFGYMTTSMSGNGREIAQRMKLLWDKRPGRILTVAVACVALVGMGCAAFTTTVPTVQEGNKFVEGEKPPKESADDVTDHIETEQQKPTNDELGGKEKWHELLTVDGSTPYLRNDLLLYTQPDMTSEMLLLQTEVEGGSAQETQQTLHLLQTDDSHWIQVETWNGITGWLYMEVPGILRIDGKLYSWDNFVVGPVVTKESLISTARREMTYQEEEDWIKHIFETEAIPVEIGKDGIQLMTDVLYQADLNEDGIPERFCYLGVSSEAYSPHFVIDGRKYYMDAGFGTGNKPDFATPTAIYVKYSGDEGRRQETYYLCNIRVGDGQVEFGLGYHKGGRKTSFLAYNGEHMNYIGTVDNIPFATADQYAFGVKSRELEQENLANGIWGFDGEGHIGLSVPIDLLQSDWYANVVWELDETSNELRLLPPADGIYEVSDPRYYEEDMPSEDGKVNYPHLVQDLTVYVEPDLQTQTLVLRVEDHGPDNKIYFTHTDNEHWIRIEDDYGVAGWFYMENYGKKLTNEGLVPALDEFDGLN